MNTFLKRALWGTLLGGGLVVLGAAAANAATTDGDDGLLSGTQAIVDVSAPVTVAGNAISVLGDSQSTGAATGVTDTTAAPPEDITSGDGGDGSGSQAVVTVSIPVTVAGNAVSVVGDSTSTDAGTTTADPPAATVTQPQTSGDDSVLGGTQGLVSVTAPVTVAGNAVSVIGDSSTTDAATTVGSGNVGAATPGVTTDGDDGIASGTQVIAPVTAPVTIAGNAVSVLGDSETSGATTTVTTGTGGTGGATTSGDDSILGGTQIVAPVTAPITIAGNAVSVIGDSTSTNATTTIATGGGAGDPATSGTGSILGGTQIVAPVTAPITIAGNAVSVIGDGTTTGSTTTVDTTTPVTPTDPVSPTDPGEGSNGGEPGTVVTTAVVAAAATGTAATMLAQTGGTAGLAGLLWAAALLATGLLVLSRGRRAVRE